MTEKPKEPESPQEDPAAPGTGDAFPGLRPGRVTTRGKVQPHEKAMLLRLAPVGLLIVALYAVPKAEAWPWWVTLVLTLMLFTIGVVILVRGLGRP